MMIDISKICKKLRMESKLDIDNNMYYEFLLDTCKYGLITDDLKRLIDSSEIRLDNDQDMGIWDNIFKEMTEGISILDINIEFDYSEKYEAQLNELMVIITPLVPENKYGRCLIYIVRGSDDLNRLISTAIERSAGSVYRSAEFLPITIIKNIVKLAVSKIKEYGVDKINVESIIDVSFNRYEDDFVSMGYDELMSINDEILLMHYYIENK